MHRTPPPQPQGMDLNQLLQKLKKPQFALPGAIVVGMLALAFGIQPGTPGKAADISAVPIERSDESVATVAPSPSATNPPASPTAVTTSATAPATSSGSGASGSGTPTSDVAGVRSTPEATPTYDEALQQTPTQCGSIKETTTPVSVEQSISGLSVKATKVAVYPIDYFRCILMATGGQEAYSLASSVLKAGEQGQTHIVLVDLWMANASKQFGQINVRNATVAAAGQTFGVLATLGGRSEVVVSSGQGRNLSLVVAIKNTIGETTGPVTLVIDGPLLAGTQVPGKYQLFLPTP
ncbi:MAG: hypothetical protein AB7J35_07855 [Dehalococcoidia bacterium]